MISISLNNARNDIIEQELKGKFEVNSTLLTGMKLEKKEHLIIISQTLWCKISKLLLWCSGQIDIKKKNQNWSCKSTFRQDH